MCRCCSQPTRLNRTLYHSKKIKSYLARRQHKFLCLERATIAEWQGASEDQKFVAKPTRLNMTLFFSNGINRTLFFSNGIKHFAAIRISHL